MFQKNINGSASMKDKLRSNSTSDSDGNESTSRDTNITSRSFSSQGTSASNSEHSPTKFRSPPPKPPRRRHSDQSAVAATGSYLYNRRQYVDGNQCSTPKDSVRMMSNVKSGSESLPSNWIAGFNDGEHEENITQNLKRLETGLSPKIAHPLSKGSLPEKYHFLGKCFPSLHENLECTEQVTLSLDNQSGDCALFYHPTPCSLYVTPFTSVSHYSVAHVKNSSAKWHSHYMSKNYDLTSSPELPINNLQYIESPKIIHRRHHSDPLLSRFNNKSFRKASGAKSSSQRSHSFIGSTCNKHCSKLEENSKYQQYLTVPKDPVLLSEEVRVLQEMNDKLWQHLCSTQSKLDTLQNSNLSTKSDSDGPSFSDLMADIYYAQKEKDDAMESRLRVAFEERDAAIHQLDEMLQVLGRSFEETDSSDDEAEMSDKEIKELLQEIETTQNPTKILQQQRILLAYLYRAKESKQQRLSHELKLALAERDAALDKVKHMEGELYQWRHSSDMWHADTKQWESSLLDTLCQVITQRDSALAKINSLQEEMDSFRICYSIQKSLSGERQTNSDYESLQKHDFIPTCLGDCGMHCKILSKTDQPSSLDEKKAEGNSSHCSLGTSSDEAEQLKAEIRVLHQKLDDEIEARHIAEENCQRLERLVNVLRKKVNGLSVGIPV